MRLKLRCFQFKRDYWNCNIFCKPHGKHKRNTYRRYAVENANDPEHIPKKLNNKAQGNKRGRGTK